MLMIADSAMLMSAVSPLPQPQRAPLRPLDVDLDSNTPSLRKLPRPPSATPVRITTVLAVNPRLVELMDQRAQTTKLKERNTPPKEPPRNAISVILMNAASHLLFQLLVRTKMLFALEHLTCILTTQLWNVSKDV
jgi:hypothetical protein